MQECQFIQKPETSKDFTIMIVGMACKTECAAPPTTLVGQSPNIVWVNYNIIGVTIDMSTQAYVLLS